MQGNAPELFVVQQASNEAKSVIRPWKGRLQLALVDKDSDDSDDDVVHSGGV
jgi:hypothetical protein